MSDRSIISESTVVRGNIDGTGSLQILGKVRGDVSVSGDVMVGPSGAVQGTIRGANVSIAGAVKGDVQGHESLLVESTAKVAGDLTAPTLGIAEGALVKGNVQTDGASRSVPRQNATSVARPATRTAATRTAAAPRAVAPPPLAAKKAPAAPKPAPPAERAAAAAPAEKKAAAKKVPPAPVVSAPKRGSRGRKKVAKR